MLSDDEHLASSAGNGLEVAAKQMAAALSEGDPQRSIEHSLGAILALSLHLQYVETAAKNFAGAHNLERVREAHRSEASSESPPDALANPADDEPDRLHYRAPRQLTG